MSKVTVVGGGIIGTMHAYLALKAGHEVVQIERDPIAQSASVRNFGLVWVSGRAAGTELELALRARELWGEIGIGVGSIGFRANGSLTIARNNEELGILEEAASLPDSKSRGFELLTAEETLKLEPALAGNYLGALHCFKDAAVEPQLLLAGLREFLLENSKYQWLPNFEVVDISSTETGHHLRDISGQKVSADLAVICAGAYHLGFLAEHLHAAPLRRVYLQMGATTPLPFKIAHSIADGDSLRYYPAFKDLSLAKLPPQNDVAKRHHMQLLAVQRFDGSMTIGDTHEYEEPFGHELAEEPYEHLRGVLGAIFGGQGPAIAKRWDGIYSQATGPEIYYRKEIMPGLTVVTGGGGRGNTLAPAIAEETVSKWK
jgi:FAD dependent oxidoreductase TIGR03364